LAACLEKGVPPLRGSERILMNANRGLTPTPQTNDAAKGGLETAIIGTPVGEP